MNYGEEIHEIIKNLNVHAMEKAFAEAINTLVPGKKLDCTVDLVKYETRPEHKVRINISLVMHDLATGHPDAPSAD